MPCARTSTVARATSRRPRRPRPSRCRRRSRRAARRACWRRSPLRHHHGGRAPTRPRRGQPRTTAHSHRGEAGCGSHGHRDGGGVPPGRRSAPSRLWRRHRSGSRVRRCLPGPAQCEGAASSSTKHGYVTRGTPTGSRTITNELSPLEVARSRYGSPPRDGALERAMDVRGVAGGAAT